MQLFLFVIDKRFAYDFVTHVKHIRFATTTSARLFQDKRQSAVCSTHSSASNVKTAYLSFHNATVRYSRLQLTGSLKHSAAKLGNDFSIGTYQTRHSSGNQYDGGYCQVIWKAYSQSEKHKTEKSVHVHLYLTAMYQQYPVSHIRLEDQGAPISKD